MKKIFFSGHSYHKKTKSSEFFIDLLNQYYNVTVHFDETWKTGELYDINLIKAEYDIVIFWQLIPAEVIKNKLHENIVFFPMFDGVSKDYNYWKRFTNIKIVNFSRTLHLMHKKWGLDSFYIQYFIKPVNNLKITENADIFFWQRRECLNINTVTKIFENNASKIHIHKSLDPNNHFTEPTKEQVEKYSITYSTWFDTREEMQEMVRSKTFYIAPREEEGIGMSFLEAMAMGRVVVANNKVTMNEYIEDGVTGFLCDINNPVSINFDVDLKKIQKNTYNYCKEGYEKWLVNRKIILVFLEKPVKTDKIRLIFTKFCVSPKELYLRIKRKISKIMPKKVKETIKKFLKEGKIK